MNTIRCGSCQDRHATVDEVRVCYSDEVLRPEPRTNGLIYDDELVAWLRDQSGNDFFESLVRYADRNAGGLTAKQHEAAKKTFDSTDAPEGIHIVFEPSAPEPDIYKVQRAVHGSGHRYAKRLNPNTGKFTYAPKAMAKLSEDTLMSLEDAQKYGKLYGMCVRCGATLTDEVSIERGIGPICAEAF